MRSLLIPLGCAALLAAGCRGEAPTDASRPPAEPAAAPATAALEAQAPDSTSAPKTKAHPLAVGWARPAVAEPHPAARGLYRRAIDRAGDPAEVTAIAKRLRTGFADSRFATRVRPGGDAAATAAVLGAAVAVAITVLEREGISAP